MKRAHSGSASPSPKKSKPNPTEKRARSGSVNKSPSAKKSKPLGLSKPSKFTNRGIGNVFALTKPEVTWSVTTTSVGEPINLESLAKFVTVPGKYTATEIVGQQSIKGKAVYRETRTQPATGKINSSVMILKINMVFLAPNQTASISVFKNGKIIIRSSGPWERIARILAKEYLPGKFHTMMEKAGKSNYVSKFYCNRKINVEAIYERLMSASSFKAVDTADWDFLEKESNKTKEPHWFDENADPFAKPAAPAPLPNKAFKKTKISVSTKEDPKVTLNIFTTGTVVAFSNDPSDGPRAFKSLELEMPSDAMFQAGNKMTSPPVKINKAQNMMERRYKLAPSWNATKNGFYVRPGSNGKPRFYELKDVKLQKTKTIRAYLDAGVNIPTNVRTKFSISNANVEAVRSAAPKKVQKKTTKKNLLNVAFEKNLAHVSGKMKVANIKKAIQSPQNTSVNVIVNGVKHTFLANGSVRRGTRTRQFSSLKKEQNTIARAYLTANQYAEYAKKTAKNRYQYILNTKAAKATAAAAAKAAKAAPKAKASSASSSMNINNNNFALNLELAVRMGNNYKHSPSNLTRLKAALNKAQNKAQVWKVLTKEFKKKAQAKANKEKLYAKAIVPNWVPNNKKQQFKNVLVRAALVPKKKNAKMAVRSWINSSMPTMSLAAHNVENLNTGEIKHIPAWNPPKNFKFKIPKLSPNGAKKSPSPVKPGKSQVNNYVFKVPGSKSVNKLTNAMANVGLNAKKGHTWNELVKAGVNKKFKPVWDKHVAVWNKMAATGPIKRYTS
jgi:hypothetical protein